MYKNLITVLGINHVSNQKKISAEFSWLTLRVLNSKANAIRSASSFINSWFLEIQGVLALCEFHYCEFRYRGFSKLSSYISKNLANAILFCYCVHTWLMRYFGQVPKVA